MRLATLMRCRRVFWVECISMHERTGCMVPELDTLSTVQTSHGLLPVDLSHVPLSKNSLYPSETSGTFVTVSTNVSMKVPAIKARLECNPVEQVSTISSWLGVTNLTDEGSIIDEYIARLNSTSDLELYYFPGGIFENSSSQTTVLSDSRRVVCCSNGHLNSHIKAL